MSLISKMNDKRSRRIKFSRFVHNDVNTSGENKISVLEDVNETTRSSDDDLATHPQLETLFFTGQASDDRHGPDTERCSELHSLFLDLLSELTSGSKNDGIWALKNDLLF